MNRYFEFLAELKKIILTARHGFQENPEVLFIGGGAGCQYDRCERKRTLTGARVCLVYSEGVRTYSFHSDCLERLLNDRRFPIEN